MCGGGSQIQNYAYYVSIIALCNCIVVGYLFTSQLCYSFERGSGFLAHDSKSLRKDVNLTIVMQV